MDNIKAKAEELRNQNRYRKELKNLTEIFILPSDENFQKAVTNSSYIQNMFKEYDTMGIDVRNFLNGSSREEKIVEEMFLTVCARFSYRLNAHVLALLKNEELKAGKRAFRYISHNEMKDYFSMKIKAKDIKFDKDIDDDCYTDESLELTVKYLNGVKKNSIKMQKNGMNNKKVVIQ